MSTLSMNSDASIAQQNIDGGGYSIVESAYFQNNLKLAVDCVYHVANSSNINPSGFIINNSFLEWNGLSIDEARDVICEFAETLESYGSVQYQFLIDAMCKAVTSHFSVKVN